jgi:hypothetical protein
MFTTAGAPATPNNEAVAVAQRALAIIEQFETIVKDLDQLHEHVALEYRPEVSLVKSRAESLLKMLNNKEDGEEVLRVLNSDSSDAGSSIRGVIAKLGIGSEIIRLRNMERQTFKQIGERFSLSETTVSKFCRLYDRMTPLEKVKERNRSIMDFVGHWEEMGSLIYRMLAKLENDPENHVRYISELRQLLKNVEGFQARYTAQQELQQVKDIVREILIQELPEKQALILARFKDTGVNKLLSQGRE